MARTEAARGAAPIALSLAQARLLQVAAQGLLRRPPRARRADLLAAIRRMRVLQIDTINVVARSSYFVLFSRLGRYPMAWLDAALASGAIFECWSHEACFAPSEDYALHRAHQLGRDAHWAARMARRVRAEHADAMDELLASIRANGAVRAADFERGEHASGGWWGWKDEKRWLEAWFALGELMVARRENFQRVYDLRERVVAALRTNVGATFDDGAPDADAMQRRFALEAVRALGVTQARWIADYFRTGRRYKDAALDALVESGDLVRVAVAGWDAPGYVHREHRALAESTAAGALRANHTTLLSPFDPIVWDRERASEMWNFDYRIECYTPAAKRRYGYFVLPILRRGALVGRLDAKAHRADGTFEVKALFLEPGVRPSDALARDMARAIDACARWHETPIVALGRVDPQPFARTLRAALALRE